MKQMRVSRSCVDALLQVHQVEVAQVDAALGERLVELHHGRLVFGTDGPDGHRLCRPSWSTARRSALG